MIGPMGNGSRGLMGRWIFPNPPIEKWTKRWIFFYSVLSLCPPPLYLEF